MSKIPKTEYAEYYASYVAHYDGLQLEEHLRKQKKNYVSLIRNVNRPVGYSYADGKWSLGELLLHINDAERVFQYRALAIARGEQQPLPGYEQDDYLELSGAGDRDYDDLLTEFEAVRDSTVILFDSFDQTALSRLGVASGHPVSVRALGYMILGHVQHHSDIISERYSA